MFAVIKTGGKQYKVSSGDTLREEKLNALAGEKIQFNNILMIGGTKSMVGTPLVKDAGVQAEVIDQIKGDNTINFVKRRRKHSSKRTKGHRQQLTLLRITEILASGASKSGIKEALDGAGLVIDRAIAPEPRPKKVVKAEPKAKAAPKAQAEPKAKATPKAKAASKAKAAPKAKAEKDVNKEKKDGS